MTAYVLLAQLTSQPAPAQEELASASLIAKWISSQQNPNGGFSSTQVSCFPPATSDIEVSQKMAHVREPGGSTGSFVRKVGTVALQWIHAVPPMAAKFLRGCRQRCQAVPLGREIC